MSLFARSKTSCCDLINEKKNKNKKFLKVFDQRNFGSLPRIFISGLISFIFFYSMPQ